MKNSPVDDVVPENDADDFFGHGIGEHALPTDDDIDVKLTSGENERLHEIIAEEVRKRNSHPLLAQITVSFEYVDNEGFSNWVNLNYFMKDETDG